MPYRNPKDARILKRKQYLELRRLVLQKYGNKCVKCGFNDPRALQIDHVNGGGKSERKIAKNVRTYYRKILRDEAGIYQLLCANCNWIKRAEKKEI